MPFVSSALLNQFFSSRVNLVALFTFATVFMHALCVTHADADHLLVERKRCALPKRLIIAFTVDFDSFQCPRFIPATTATSKRGLIQIYPRV